MALPAIFHDALLGSWALALGKVDDVFEAIAAVLVASSLRVVLLVGQGLLVLHLLLKLHFLLFSDNWMFRRYHLLVRALLLSCLSRTHHSTDKVVLGTGQAVVVSLRVALGRRSVH